MIPKIIHYVWFGDKSIPQDHKSCIAGRKKTLSDYEFVLRNESDFDINCSRITQQSASHRKWGFIVDYIRAYVVYNYGRIYLDMDVEILKDITPILKNEYFSGFEDGKYINPGSIFAGKKGSRITNTCTTFPVSPQNRIVMLILRSMKYFLGEKIINNLLQRYIMIKDGITIYFVSGKINDLRLYSGSYS